MTENLLLVVIVTCEIAFWVVLFTGLFVRYILNLKKLSTVLLVSVPLIDGEPAAKAPTHGWELIRYELIWWLRCVLAVIVTQILVFLAIIFIDDPKKSEELNLWFKLPLATVVLWFIFGPVWVLLFNRSPRETKDSSQNR